MVMAPQPTPVANDLVHYCTEVLRPLFDEKGAVVWYDRDGVLEGALRAAADRHGWHMVPEPGARNPLAARAALEEQLEADGCQWRAERKWLVYVAAERQDPSWYADLELAGRVVQKGLAELLAEPHNLPVPRVRPLLTAPVARRLLAQWNRLFPLGTWRLDLEQLGAALLALAFGKAGPLTPQEAVLRFLDDPARHAQALRAEGLTGTFVHIVRTQLGFGRLPEADDVKPALLVRAMLASELVHKGACEAGPALHNFLPQKNHIGTWAGLAQAAVKDAGCRDAFRQLAAEVEAEVRLVQHAGRLRALTAVASLPSADERLLEEAAVRCQAAGPAGAPAVWAELCEWADERLKLGKAGVPVADDWLVVAGAARLLLGLQTAEEELARLPNPPAPDDLVRRYTERQDGWWHLDDLHRGLELRFPSCRPGIVEHLGKPAVAALWKWSRRLAAVFAGAFERAGAYGAGSAELLPHHRFWSELVETGDLGETAVLFVDALRLDLAENLLAGLQDRARELTSRLALAALPSKTPVGMASLLPRGGSPLVVLARNGKLRAEIDGRDVSGPDGRKDQLRRHVPDALVGQLKDVPEPQLAQAAAARSLAVLMTRDIDAGGEIAADVSPSLFEEMVADLTRWVTVLHRAGYRRVVIGTDHGFLLVPAGASFEEDRGPGNSGDTTFSTRYAVGPLSGGDSCIAFSPASLGRGGSANVVVPKGLAAFATGGPRHKFVHGGLSPQECLLRFVVSTLAGPPRAPVQVRLARAVNIPSLILFLGVEVTAPAGSAQSRRVRVEAHAGGRRVGRSEPVTYRPLAELAAGESHPRLKLTLTKAPAAVDLLLLDDDSGEVLDTQEGVPSVMRRAEEEDLL
jgi:hypothetical protein